MCSHVNTTTIKTESIYITLDSPLMLFHIQPTFSLWQPSICFVSSIVLFLESQKNSVLCRVVEYALFCVWCL